MVRAFPALVLGALLFANFVHAASTPSVPSAPYVPGSSGGGSGGFYFSLGAKALYGSMKSGDATTIENRNLAVYGLETVLAYDFSYCILGVGFDYNLWKQLKNPSQLNDTNTGGTQTQTAAVLGYKWNPFTFLAKYYFGSTYAMSVADSTGNKPKFSDPGASYALQILYNYGGRSNLGLEFNSFEYGKSDSGGTKTTLDADDKIKASAVGVVYAWIY